MFSIFHTKQDKKKQPLPSPKPEQLPPASPSPLLPEEPLQPPPPIAMDIPPRHTPSPPPASQSGLSRNHTISAASRSYLSQTRYDRERLQKNLSVKDQKFFGLSSHNSGNKWGAVGTPPSLGEEEEEEDLVVESPFPEMEGEEEHGKFDRELASAQANLQRQASLPSRWYSYGKGRNDEDPQKNDEEPPKVPPVPVPSRPTAQAVFAAPRSQNRITVQTNLTRHQSLSRASGATLLSPTVQGLTRHQSLREARHASTLPQIDDESPTSPSTHSQHVRVKSDDVSSPTATTFNIGGPGEIPQRQRSGTTPSLSIVTNFQATKGGHHPHAQFNHPSPSGGVPRSPWMPTPEEAVSLSRRTSLNSHRSTSPVPPGLTKPPTSALDSSNTPTAPNGGRLSPRPPAKHNTLPGSIQNTPTTPRKGPQLQLLTNRDALIGMVQNNNGNNMISPVIVETQQGRAFLKGPQSAAPYVPPIGHSHRLRGPVSAGAGGEEGDGSILFSPQSGGGWTNQKESVLGRSNSQSEDHSGSNEDVQSTGNSEEAYRTFQALAKQQEEILWQIQQNREMIDRIQATSPIMPPVTQPPWMRNNSPYSTQAMSPIMLQSPYSPYPMMGRSPITPVSAGGPGLGRGAGVGAGVGAPGNGSGATNFDIQKLVEEKGYNPKNFDLKPPRARFFVIKSYTEEDVHKSLKYEIWASTDLGNKRLDRAFKESNENGPIYLFFSVNGSGHFCGIAQMLTEVDYNTSSNVWAQDKWKGVFKVKWIFVKDVPLSALRHIKLENTAEKKAVTSSRDTQEVLYDAGLEVLRIIATYHSNTSLVQDYGFYETKELDKRMTPGSSFNSPATLSPLTTNLPPYMQHKSPRTPSSARINSPADNHSGRRFNSVVGGSTQ